MGITCGVGAATAVLGRGGATAEWETHCVVIHVRTTATIYYTQKNQCVTEVQALHNAIRVES